MLKISARYLAVFFLFFFFLLQFPVLVSNSKSCKQEGNTGFISAGCSDAIIIEADSLYRSMRLASAGLSKNVFALALKGYKKLKNLSELSKEGILSIVDFSKPSSKKRLYILDLNNGEILLNTLVAHGRNSGMNYASSFSNKPESNKSSLGFYVTLNTYWGENGYALRLKGEEPGVNDNAYDRNIVIHGSDYVNEKFMRSAGHLGRSLGCPAVPKKLHEKVINYIKNGSCLFIYHPTKQYLKQSKLVNS